MHTCMHARMHIFAQAKIDLVSLALVADEGFEWPLDLVATFKVGQFDDHHALDDLGLHAGQEGEGRAHCTCRNKRKH